MVCTMASIQHQPREEGIELTARSAWPGRPSRASRAYVPNTLGADLRFCQIGLELLLPCGGCRVDGAAKER